MRRPQTIEIPCASCSMTVTLVLIGGQYQNSYQGNCAHCNEYWLLCSGEDDSSGIPRYEEEPKHSLECPECNSTGKFVAEIGGHKPTFSIENIDPDDPKHSLSKDLEIEKVTCWQCSHTDSFECFYTPAS